MKIISNKGIWFSVSSILILGAVLLWISVGLNLGIDFTGGSLLEVEYVDTVRPDRDTITQTLADLEIQGSFSETGESGYIMRFQDVTEEKHQEILSQLDTLATEQGHVDELRFNSIGPVIGQELANKSVEAMFMVLLAIIIYIAYAFRKVSYPVQSWKYGLVAIITLFHDVVITVGLFIIAGQVLGWEVNTSFVAALLTILGYSVNDTIVIFDRIRENLHRVNGTFEEVVETSVQETIPRSLNTSITTFLVLAAIFFFGGSTVQPFVGTLMFGVFIGTYSSIFIASPLLVAWQQMEWKLKSK